MTTRLIRSLETPAGRVPVASRRSAPGDARPVAAAPGVEARLRKARMADARTIQDLVAIFADRDEMLHRSVGEIHENIRDYSLVEEGDRIVGCAALHVNLDQLAEIKSLAVVEECQGKGYGKRLVLACLDEARDLGLGTVFALTYRPGFFEKLGFHVVDKATLPHKVWTECIRCPKFPDCGEIAVVCHL